MRPSPRIYRQFVFSFNPYHGKRNGRLVSFLVILHSTKNTKYKIRSRFRFAYFSLHTKWEKNKWSLSFRLFSFRVQWEKRQTELEPYFVFRIYCWMQEQLRTLSSWCIYKDDLLKWCRNTGNSPMGLDWMLYGINYSRHEKTSFDRSL